MFQKTKLSLYVIFSNDFKLFEKNRRKVKQVLLKAPCTTVNDMLNSAKLYTLRKVVKCRSRNVHHTLIPNKLRQSRIRSIKEMTNYNTYFSCSSLQANLYRPLEDKG